MKVVCISNEYESDLTIGEKYDVIGVYKNKETLSRKQVNGYVIIMEPNEPIYEIKDNGGHTSWFPGRLFMNINDYRNNILENKLGI